MTETKYSEIRITEIPKLPDKIIEAYKDHRLIIFVGAGMSRLMGCQGWEQMANDLIRNICSPAEAEQILNSTLSSKARITIADRKAKKNGKEDVFWETFKKAITPRDNPKYDIYETILKLGGPIITTNCDDLLTKHLPHSYTTKCTPDSLIENEGKDYVFCIHGHYGKGTEEELETLVFTMDKYLEKYTSGSELVAFLQQAMQGKMILFLGYGLNEFEIISNAFKSGDRIEIRHYMLEGFFNYQKELAEAQAEYYASQGVQLIAYSKDIKGYDQQKEIIERWVEQLEEETPYRSRNAIKVSEAIKQYTDSNLDIIIKYLNSDDKNRDINLKAILDEVGSSADCSKWFYFLIQNKYITESMLLEKKKGPFSPVEKVEGLLTGLVDCDLTTADESELATFRNFIYVCDEMVTNSKTLISNLRLISLLGEASVKFNVLNDDKPWRIIDKWIHSSFESGVIWIEQNIKIIKSLSEKSQTKLLSKPYDYEEEKRRRDRSYWIKRLSIVITHYCGIAVLKDVAKQCFVTINKLGDEHAIFHSLDDRFQFSSEGYEESLYQSSCSIFLKLEEQEKNELIGYMLTAAKSPLGYQVALRFACDNKYHEIKSFNGNPLLIANTYVEFFYWLEATVYLLSENDITIVNNWIEEADFGYSYPYDDNRNQLISETIDTYKYQLYGILGNRNKTYLSKQNALKRTADINRKNPSEDKERYYAIQTLEDDVYFEKGIDSRLTGKELIDLVQKEVNKSIWSNKSFVRRDVQRKMVSMITDEQFHEYVKELLLLSSEQFADLFSEISTVDLLKKCSKDTVNTILERLEKYLCEKDFEEEKSAVSSLIIHLISELSQYEWSYEEVFEIALKTNAISNLPKREDLNADWSLATNILNLKECIYYATVISSVYGSGQDAITESFKEWYKSEERSSRKKILHLTCAYYYGMIVSIDPEWAKQMLDTFRKEEYLNEIALCICNGATYVEETAVQLVADKNTLLQMFDITKAYPKLYDEAGMRAIVYITAAYFFGHIETVKYTNFLEVISPSQCGKVFSAATTSISTEDDSRRQKFLKKVYSLIRAEKGPEIASSAINYIYKLKSLTGAQWSIIEDAIQNALCDRGVWQSVEMCLRRTRKNSKILEAAIAQLVNNSPALESYDYYIVDDILEQLARLKAKLSITSVAKFAVEKCGYKSTIYGRIEDDPDGFILRYEQKRDK